MTGLKGPRTLKHGANVATGVWTDMQAKAVFIRSFSANTCAPGTFKPTSTEATSVFEYEPIFPLTPSDCVEALLRLAAAVQTKSAEVRH